MKLLGKIKSANLGFGGVDDQMFGVTLELAGEGWTIPYFMGFWSPSIVPRYEDAPWTETERQSNLLVAVLRIEQILHQALCRNLSDLPGTPIQIEVEGDEGPLQAEDLVSWRVLTEVL